MKLLNTPLVMVLSHSRCGAVDAAIKVVRDSAILPGHRQEMVGELRPTLQAAEADKPEDVLAAAIAENVRHGVRRLETTETILAEFVKSRKIRAVGAHDELASGKTTLV